MPKRILDVLQRQRDAMGIQRKGKKKNGKSQVHAANDEVWRIAEAAAAASKPFSIRNKALILFDFMVGFRRNVVLTARWGMFSGYSEDDCPIPIQLWCDDFLSDMARNKVWACDDKFNREVFGGEYTYSFIDKEGFLIMKEYRREREKREGHLEDNDFLFTKTGNRPYIHENLRGQEAGNIFKAGLRATNITPRSCTFHSLRRSFKMACVAAGVDMEAREAMMAHKRTGSAGFYWDNHHIDRVIHEYEKVDWSPIGTHQIARIENELQQLKQENMLLHAQLKELRSKTVKDELLERIKRLEESLGAKQV